jgi:release factor glutamine methyltransferase
MAKTYNDLYLNARHTLRGAGIEAYSLEARILVAHAAGRTPEALLQDMNLYTSDAVAECAESLLARRLRGEPAAYITGNWEFFGLPIAVDPSVIIPRPDTETLVYAALRCLQGKTAEPRVLDLCAGSGCVGAAIAHEVPDARVVMADISAAALSVCRKNVLQNSLSPRVTCIEVDALKPPPARIGSFDLIVSNPPYIPTDQLCDLDVSVREYEPIPALDGGKDGMDFHRAIVDGWKPLLRDGGCMILEVGEGQAEAVRKILLMAGFRSAEIEYDTARIARVLVGRL